MYRSNRLTSYKFSKLIVRDTEVDVSVGLLVLVDIIDPGVLQSLVDQHLSQVAVLLVEAAFVDKFFHKELTEEREVSPGVRLLDDESLEQVPKRLTKWEIGT